jgi:hypothetical protein
MIFNSFAFSLAAGNVLVASIVFVMAGAKFCAQLTGNLSTNTWGFIAFQLAGPDDIPTKTSQLTNDSGFVTEEDLHAESLVGTTADITPSQVIEAITNGRDLMIIYTDKTFGVFGFTAFDAQVSLNLVYSSAILTYNGMYAVVELIGDLNANTWQFTVQQIPIMSDIPAPLIGTTDEVTPSQVSEAVEAGRDVSITYNDATYGAVVFSSFMKSQGFKGVFSSEILLYAGTYVLVELYGNIQTNYWSLLTTQLAQYSDVPTKVSQLNNDSGFLTSAPVTSVNGKTGAVSIDIPTVPSALKNPYALTINGTAYDGSSAVDMTEKVNALIDAKLSAITNAEEVAF